MPSLPLVPERAGDPAQREAAVHHRPRPGRLERAHELRLVAPAAHEQALQAGLLARQERGRHPDQRDVAADAHRRDRPRQRARPAALDRGVDPAPAGPVRHPLARSSSSSEEEVTTTTPIAFASCRGPGH